MKNRDVPPKAADPVGTKQVSQAHCHHHQLEIGFNVNFNHCS